MISKLLQMSELCQFWILHWNLVDFSIMKIALGKVFWKKDNISRIEITSTKPQPWRRFLAHRNYIK